MGSGSDELRISGLPVGSDTPKPGIQDMILSECLELAEFLQEKNKAYGNSALEPVRIFSRADTVEQLRVRIDDKLSRLMRGKEYAGDDSIKDLLGYLILLRIAMRKEQ